MNPLLITVLIILLLLFLASWLTARFVFYSPHKGQNDDHRLMKSAQMEPFRELTHEMVDRLLAVPCERVELRSYDGLTLSARYYHQADDAPLDGLPPIVSKELYQMAQQNLGRGSKDYRAYDHVRKSIFSGIAVCAQCGHSLCSCGTVYKGEREKYWYLSCTHQRQGLPQVCDGTRIRYTDLVEVIRQDLNSLLHLNEQQIQALVTTAVKRVESDGAAEKAKQARENASSRLQQIDQIVTKLYMDNTEGHLSDDRLHTMVQKLEAEAQSLQAVFIPYRCGVYNDKLCFIVGRDEQTVACLHREEIVVHVGTKL